MWVILDKTTRKYWGPFGSGLDIREFISRSWPDIPRNIWTNDKDHEIQIISLNSPTWSVKS